MKVTINGHEYQFLMMNEFGPQYRYECLFGSAFVEDMQSEDLSRKKLAVMRFVYAVLVNDNDYVEEDFNEFLRYITDRQMTELTLFYQERFRIIHSLNANANDDTTEEEDSAKKD